MPDEPTPNKQPMKPNENPTRVREPDNTRPPGEPTPQHPSKPMSTGGADASEADATAPSDAE